MRNQTEFCKQASRESETHNIIRFRLLVQALKLNLQVLKLVVQVNQTVNQTDLIVKKDILIYCTETYLPSYNFSQSNGMDCILIFLCFIIPSIHGYSLKINPHIQTAVNTLQARGSNNTLSFSQISNATILNAIPAQIQQSHQNELISFSITLVIFTLVFLVLAKIINQQVLTTYKLHLRIANLEAVCLENLQ